MNLRFVVAPLSFAIVAGAASLGTACGDPASSGPATATTPTASSVASSSASSAPSAPSSGDASVSGSSAEEAGAPLTSVADSGGDAGSPTDTCAITGGVGAPLYGPMDTTEAECTSQCALLADTHPNRACLWGANDLAPTGTCVVVGGAGASLYGPDAQTQGACFARCTSFQVTNVNLDCAWTGSSGSLDITPEDTCTIAGGVGAPIFGPAVDRRGLCLDQCLATIPSRPNCTCTWGAVNLRE